MNALSSHDFANYLHASSVFGAGWWLSKWGEEVSTQDLSSDEFFEYIFSNHSFERGREIYCLSISLILSFDKKLLIEREEAEEFSSLVFNDYISCEHKELFQSDTSFLMNMIYDDVDFQSGFWGRVGITQLDDAVGHVHHISGIVYEVSKYIAKESFPYDFLRDDGIKNQIIQRLCASINSTLISAMYVKEKGGGLTVNEVYRNLPGMSDDIMLRYIKYPPD